jgi:malate synthase-like protein
MLTKYILRQFHRHSQSSPSSLPHAINLTRTKFTRCFSTISTINKFTPSSSILSKIPLQQRSTMAQIDLAVNTQSGCVEFIIPPDSTTTEVLSPDALVFLKKLHRNFEPRRRELLAMRAQRQQDINDGNIT